MVFQVYIQQVQMTLPDLRFYVRLGTGGYKKTETSF